MLSNLFNILIYTLLFVFSISIFYHYLKGDILEGMENDDDDDDDNNNNSNSNSSSSNSNNSSNNNNNSCNASPATNSGQIEFLKSSLKELKGEVEKNTKNIAKLSEEKEQVKKNTKMINQNSNAILKATTSQLGVKSK